jgi:CRP-like cAMP-binding protein
MAQERSRSRDTANLLLAGIQPDGRQKILAGSRPKTFRPSQIFYHAGEPAEHLFVLRKGHVQIGRLTRTGREVVIGILASGDMFGLSSMMRGRSEYFWTAKALESGEMLIWTRDVIRRFAREYPRLSGNVLQVVLGYVAHFADRHEELLSGTAELRVGRALTRLGTQIGTAHSSGIEVRIKNEQLASLADVSAFTVSRLLKRWERKGVVRKRRGVVHIVHPEKLLID